MSSAMLAGATSSSARSMGGNRDDTIPRERIDFAHGLIDRADADIRADQSDV